MALKSIPIFSLIASVIETLFHLPDKSTIVSPHLTINIISQMQKKSSGEIINRITQDADSLSFAFGRLLNLVSSLVSSLIIIVYVFINSWIIGLEIVFLVSLLFLIIKILLIFMERILLI